MTGWLLTILTLVFAFLAYDASSRSTLGQSLPLQEGISHLSREEQEQARFTWERRGIGQPAQLVWLFAMIAVASGCAAAYAFFG